MPDMPLKNSINGLFPPPEDALPVILPPDDPPVEDPPPDDPVI